MALLRFGEYGMGKQTTRQQMCKRRIAHQPGTNAETRGISVLTIQHLWCHHNCRKSRPTAGEGFAIILNLLGVMAVVIALVGAVSAVFFHSVCWNAAIGVMRTDWRPSRQVIRFLCG